MACFVPYLIEIYVPLINMHNQSIISFVFFSFFTTIPCLPTDNRNLWGLKSIICLDISDHTRFPNNATLSRRMSTSRLFQGHLTKFSRNPLPSSHVCKLRLGQTGQDSFENDSLPSPWAAFSK